MLKVKFIVLGKLCEPHWRDACEEYKKRLTQTCQVQEIQLKEAPLPKNPSAGEIAGALEREADMILAHTSGRAFKVALCVEGKQYTSEKLAQLFSAKAVEGRDEIDFVIGSSHGLSERVKASADLRLSMSSLTFPHQLARVMLYECVYRCMEISRGSPYHK